MGPFCHARPDRNSLIACLLATTALSTGFENLLIRHGLNPIDEERALYAARQVSEGGRLYEDVLWVFPPGHLFLTWIGTSLASPGLVVTRLVYAPLAPRAPYSST